MCTSDNHLFNPTLTISDHTNCNPACSTNMQRPAQMPSLRYWRPHPDHATILSDSPCPEGMVITQTPVGTQSETESRSEPRMSATNRYGTGYVYTNSLFVLPRTRRLFELRSGSAPPRWISFGCCITSASCSLSCVCFLTSSNVGNRRPGFCKASTM